jgi:hypothetical protein
VSVYSKKGMMKENFVRIKVHGKGGGDECWLSE